MVHWGWFLVPVAVGLCQPVIWQMTLQLAKRAGDMPASVLMHLVGALAGGLLVLAGMGGGDAEWESLPWWAWCGGMVGVICLWSLNVTVPKVGVATFMALLVASQLIGGLFFERYGLMGAELRVIQWYHWVGVASLSLGAYLVSRA